MISKTIALFKRSVRFKPYEVFKINLNRESEICLPEGFSIVALNSVQQFHSMLNDHFDFSNNHRSVDILKGIQYGAGLICVFQGKTLAHTTWISMERSTVIYDSLFVAGVVNSLDCLFIGPCNTYVPYQGKGLYLAALSFACSIGKQSGKSHAFISAKRKNIASINGIKKAGFVHEQTVYSLVIAGKGCIFSKNCLMLKKSYNLL